MVVAQVPDTTFGCLLQVAHLTKRYGQLDALHDVSFSIRPREVLGLIGPNGAGKTTLFECLGGVLPADGGALLADGRPLTPAEQKAAVFYLPDQIAPWPSQTVRWALNFVRGYWGPTRYRTPYLIPGPTPDPTPDQIPCRTPAQTHDPTPGRTPDPTLDPTCDPTALLRPDRSRRANRGAISPASLSEIPDATPDLTSHPTPGPTADRIRYQTPYQTQRRTPDRTLHPTPGPTGDPTPGPTLDPTLDPTPDVAPVIHRLGLEPLLDVRIGELSKGQRKRALLAFGLITPQPVLLADEPFEGLDLRQTREIANTLRRHAAEGRTLVLSIHQISDAARVCDRFVLLSNGRIRGEGTLADLQRVAARAATGSALNTLEDIFLALT